MAGKGCSRHQKRLTVSRVLAVSRKGVTWIKKVSPGAHSKDYAMALVVLLRDVLKIAGDAREAKALLRQGLVLVDGKRVRDDGLPVGLMDVVSVPKTSSFWRVGFTKQGKLKPFPISKEAAGVKYCRVNSKKLVGKGVAQLGLHDGRTVLGFDAKPGDSLKMTVPGQKGLETLKLEPGAFCMVFRGKHSGDFGVLEKIVEFGEGKSNAVLDVSGGKVTTLRDYLFAVPRGFEKEFGEIAGGGKKKGEVG